MDVKQAIANYLFKFATKIGATADDVEEVLKQPLPEEECNCTDSNGDFCEYRAVFGGMCLLHYKQAVINPELLECECSEGCECKCWCHQ